MKIILAFSRLSWGSLIFEKGDCRVVVSAATSGIRNLQFFCEAEGITRDIIADRVLSE